MFMITGKAVVPVAALRDGTRVYRVSVDVTVSPNDFVAEIQPVESAMTSMASDFVVAARNTIARWGKDCHSFI